MLSSFKYILVVGFGASSLNLRALLSAKNILNKSFYFLDSLDPTLLSDLDKFLPKSETAVIFISKSGNTQETNLLLDVMRDWSNIFILSSAKESNMQRIANDIPHHWINYPDTVSGRFALLETPFLNIALEGGVDTAKIVQAVSKVDKSLAQDIAKKWMDNFQRGKRNWVLISYTRQISGLLLWIRQIISESLGKNGFGIMPIIAEGSMDEHSQLQLFLDGPDDKFYDIISTTNYNASAIGHEKLAKSQTHHAFMVEDMLKAKNRDVIHTNHATINEEVVGNYIGLYSEIVRIIADKLGFDPYNQPAVENIKQKSSHHI